MFWVILLMLLVLPGVELWVILATGAPLGVTVVIAALTAAVGWWFARQEGLDLWTELESDVHNRRLPTEEGVLAMLAVLGGWALIVPGYLTDVVGAALLVPAVQRALVGPIRATIRARLS